MKTTEQGWRQRLQALFLKLGNDPICHRVIPLHWWISAIKFAVASLLRRHTAKH